MYIKTKLHVAKIIWEQLSCNTESKISLKLSKLAYIGMWILELSKVLMYEFHYDYTENKFGNKSKPSFTDTDTLKYEIKTEDVYEDFSSNTEIFDFSNYLTKILQNTMIVQTN